MTHPGYDPQRVEPIDDPDKAYQPCYVAPEPDEDSMFDELSEDEQVVEPDSPVAYFADTPRSASGVVRNEGSAYIPTSRNKRSSDSPNIAPESDEDHEYRVEPVRDVITPAYAPSQTFGSPSAGSLSDEYSDGEPDVNAQLSLAQFKPEPQERDLAKQSSTEVGVRSDEEILSPSEDIHEVTTEKQLEQRQGFEGYDDGDSGGENQLNEDFEGFEQDEQPEAQVDGIIADIFGESDAEEEEFEGFAENEVDDEGQADDQDVAQNEPNKDADRPSTAQSEDASSRRHAADSDNDEEDDGGEGFVSDFDKIMSRKREEMRRRRRRARDIEFLNDSDDQIVAMISRMRDAADEDRQLLTENKPATRKLTMLTEVRNLLRRADLKAALVENGMLSAITEWLSPLPGHTLPNLVIRDTMLTCLRDFQPLSTEVLQESGIGKALMYLYKHPRETRENKDKAQRLINEWLRPIFNLTSDYRTLTKEERKQLDYEHLPKRRNIENENYDHRDINRELDGEGKGLLRPGDPGWVGRARVPQPSNKDYIIRPKWRVRGSGDNDDDDGDGDGDEPRPMISRRRKPGSVGAGLGTSSRIQAHIRNLASSARHGQAKVARAVQMSVEGRKMSL
ncbi:putative transcription factor IWS1 [Fasciola hepatica]|uniref:Transcription factor IWS1 n=1 Tax=Fasciola hepatica TaxID=6192 RepID=A0A4E0RA39_FASHE|nr:putative transcription factor IWS1 [Fasciola hepatica]